MTLKRLFVVTAGITTGVALALGTAFAVYLWWDSRPTPPDTTSVLARFDGAFTSTDEEGKKVGVRYVLENTSERDVYEFGQNLTVHIRREDGSLIDLKVTQPSNPSDIEIPARERVVWFLDLNMPYSPYPSIASCKGLAFPEDPSKEDVQRYIDHCYGKFLNGFRVQSGGKPRLVIELPAPRSEKKGDGP